jgi:hypothetical protein
MFAVDEREVHAWVGRVEQFQRWGVQYSMLGETFECSESRD